MTSKQKRKMLTKSLSHDVTPLSQGHQSNSSNSVAGSTSNLSEETAGKDVRLVRREEFICSDNHHAHLEEDYLEDESRLFGRQLTLPTAASGNFHLKSSSSRRTLRKLFKSKSVDTHSMKSSANVDVSVVRDEVDRRFEAAILNNAEQDDHKMPAEDEEEVASPLNSNSLPRKPPRKRGPSLSIDARNGSVDVRSNENEVTNNEQGRRGDLDRPRLLRSNSVIRPLECDPRPKLYSRQSITHARQFSQESTEGVDDDHVSLAVDANNRSNGTVMAMSPERPQRRRYSQLVKRESVIHPTRPPRRRPPLGTSSLYQPLIVNGRFQNPWSTWRKPSFVGSLRWTFATKDNSAVPNSAEELDKVLPVLPLRLDDVRHPPLDGIRVTWLGHATVLVQFGDISVLTDPMFSDRASPLGFFGPKRIRRFPGSVYDLPKLDAVVISHNHYDHLDYNSVLLLNARFGAELHWFVPVGLRTWMHNAGCETVTELTWWAKGSLSHPSDVSFCFTPAQHWSKRTPTDDNKVLWGSWCILAPRYRFFFAGDTGYCDAFKQIGEQFGPFDMAAIPIGAYEPRWFMHNQHIDPTEAVKIHQDIKADKSLGIHWGTFILTNEHYLEPPLKLADAVRHAGLLNDDFFVLKHGESRLIHGS